jgi:hypothetical protein
LLKNDQAYGGTEKDLPTFPYSRSVSAFHGEGFLHNKRVRRCFRYQII